MIRHARLLDARVRAANAGDDRSRQAGETRAEIHGVDYLNYGQHGRRRAVGAHEDPRGNTWASGWVILVRR
jgi:hypothetical protein